MIYILAQNIFIFLINLVTIPFLVRCFFPSVLWRVPTQAKEVFFTFDDGPTPEITEQVLAILNKYNAKATFFCIGDRVQKHPAIFDKIKTEGHSVGNHTYNHFNGLKKQNKRYFENIKKADGLINSTLFRPPYGKMKWSQYKKIRKKYKVVLWDIIPGDFIERNSVEKIVSNIVNNVSSGSIIVLHDSEKCAEKMLQVLPLALETLSKQNYSFKQLYN